MSLRTGANTLIISSLFPHVIQKINQGSKRKHIFSSTSNHRISFVRAKIGIK
jgi:hypothetical protein